AATDRRHPSAAQRVASSVVLCEPPAVVSAETSPVDAAANTGPSSAGGATICLASTLRTNGSRVALVCEPLQPNRRYAADQPILWILSVSTPRGSNPTSPAPSAPI